MARRTLNRRRWTIWSSSLVSRPISPIKARDLRGLEATSRPRLRAGGPDGSRGERGIFPVKANSYRRRRKRKFLFDGVAGKNKLEPVCWPEGHCIRLQSGGGARPSSGSKDAFPVAEFFRISPLAPKPIGKSSGGPILRDEVPRSDPDREPQPGREPPTAQVHLVFDRTHLEGDIFRFDGEIDRLEDLEDDARGEMRSRFLSFDLITS